MNYYLAVDIGASSGRHMLAHFENERIILEEIYRFENGMIRENGHLYWDVERLFQEIVNGLCVCKDIGKIPVTMAIDTWGVDYVLLDEKGCAVSPAYGYRDSRTAGMDRKVYEIIPRSRLYARTGIQHQSFNTVFQLMALKEEEPEVMDKAAHLLLMPDYLEFKLTGVMKTEYTNATTTGLVSPVTKDWDKELIRMLGYKESVFGQITTPGTEVGRLLPEITRKTGFNLTVIQTTSHDTASAVLAVPAEEEDFLYISSGTWSLMGTELKQAVCSERAQEANLTNEGGYDYRFRLIKNIMGLWMIQSVRHELSDSYSFAEICSMAEECRDFPSRVDVNDDRFLAPDSMIAAVQCACLESGQKVPETVGQIAAVIYSSLAECYGRTLTELEEITGRKFQKIHIVGGGANADYLNQLTANAAGRTCLCGPTEGTAIGNILVQMMQNHMFSDIWEARKAVFRSFQIKMFTPDYQKKEAD